MLCICSCDCGKVYLSSKMYRISSVNPEGGKGHNRVELLWTLNVVNWTGLTLFSHSVCVATFTGFKKFPRLCNCEWRQWLQFLSSNTQRYTDFILARDYLVAMIMTWPAAICALVLSIKLYVNTSKSSNFAEKNIWIFAVASKFIIAYIENCYAWSYQLILAYSNLSALSYQLVPWKCCPI